MIFYRVAQIYLLFSHAIVICLILLSLLACKIASEWPSSVLEALVTGLILNIASGLNVSGKTISALNKSF